MNNPDDLAHRLALLESVTFSPAELQIIAQEIEDNLRIIAELEQFAGDTSFISQQAQPTANKA